LALLGGIATAMAWINLSPSSYYDALEGRIAVLTLPDWIAAEPGWPDPRGRGILSADAAVRFLPWQ